MSEDSRCSVIQFTASGERMFDTGCIVRAMGENDRSPGRIHATQPNGFDDVPSHDVRDDALIRGMDAFHARAPPRSSSCCG